jgi:hypothetical protein
MRRLLRNIVDVALLAAILWGVVLEWMRHRELERG